MSRIYFHSEHETAELSGRERAHMGTFCSSLLQAALGIDQAWLSDAARYRALVPREHYTQGGTDEQFLSSFRTWLSVGEGEFGLETKTDPFTAALNTALVIGGDAVRLMARLHGRCEVHAFVEGANRSWLADIIDRGRATNVLRAGMGWEACATMLRQRDDAPVVTSYSVCMPFPNAAVAGWKDDQDGDGFYDLSKSQQWAMAMPKLRESGGGLEMRPDDWGTFYFHGGASGFDIASELFAPQKQ